MHIFTKYNMKINFYIAKMAECKKHSAVKNFE